MSAKSSRKLCCAVLGAALVAPALAAKPSLTPTAIAFATVDEGQDILTTHDDFLADLSPFDRAARMKTDRDVSEEEYLQFVARNVLEWTPEEKARVQSAWNSLLPPLQTFSLPFPDTIVFIKTTGDEEGGAEYTRANAIILPRAALLPDKSDALRGTIAHELFHVLSRHAPALRDKAYAVIGFEPCGDVPFPPGFSDRKLTNPDAPRNDHCIRLQVGQDSTWALPILVSKAAHYNVANGGTVFQYVEMKFLAVQRTGDGLATYDEARPKFLDVAQIRGFFEQVGRNTNYIIHPEEILADNFKLLLLGTPNLPSPDIQRALVGVLRGQ